MDNKKKVSKKGNTKKKNTIVNGKDPIGARTVFFFFILFMVLTFAVGACSIVLSSEANEHNGIMFVLDKYYANISDYNTGIPKQMGAGFDSKNTNIQANSDFGFMHIVNGHAIVCRATAVSVDGDIITTNLIDKAGNLVRVKKADILGVFVNELSNPLVLAFTTSPTTYLIVFTSFVAFTIILGLIYYLVSPRGAKQLETKIKEEKKKNTTQTVTTINSENSELLSHYLSTDDNIQPIDPEQNQVGALLNINYYNSVRLHNGEVYCVVKKYKENARKLEEFGASDMDIIRMNMIGNSEFEDLILNTHKEKSMTLWEIIDFARTLDGVYCVKKRGTLNWTYKYKSKTLFIVKREDDNSDSYKVAIKVYPDAANKLNIIYKALEDSSFPNGPYWYMFNDLRNLPANVIKWLMTESLNISKWQQTKADLLRDTPTLESYKLDVDYMRDMIVANTRSLDMTKFVLITQNDADENVKYNTCLETGFDDMNMDQFTKEIAMPVPGLKNVQMSILTRKNASEALVGALCDELLDFKPKKDEVEPNNLNNIVNTPTTTKVVKKSDRKRR